MWNCLIDEQKSSAQKTSSSQPPRSDSYHNKPAPALPRQEERRRDDREYSSSSRPVPSAGRNAASHQLNSANQPGGNYGYGQSPPSGSKYDGGRDERRDGGRPLGGRVEPNRGPASPALAGSEDASLLPLFRAVDKDGMCNSHFRLRSTAPVTHQHTNQHINQPTSWDFH